MITMPCEECGRPKELWPVTVCEICLYFCPVCESQNTSTLHREWHEGNIRVQERQRAESDAREHARILAILESDASGKSATQPVALHQSVVWKQEAISILKPSDRAPVWKFQRKIECHAPNVVSLDAHRRISQQKADDKYPIPLPMCDKATAYAELMAFLHEKHWTEYDVLDSRVLLTMMLRSDFPAADIAHLINLVSRYKQA